MPVGSHGLAGSPVPSPRSVSSHSSDALARRRPSVRDPRLASTWGRGLLPMILALVLACTAGCGAGGPVAAPARAPIRPGVVEPAVLRIPSLSVAPRPERLGLDKTGALQPPADPQEAGWFAAGPAPGDIGPAVIAGHVDSTQALARFHH